MIEKERERERESKRIYVIDCHCLRRSDFLIGIGTHETEAIAIGMKATIDFHKRESRRTMFRRFAGTDSKNLGDENIFRSH